MPSDQLTLVSMYMFSMMGTILMLLPLLIVLGIVARIYLRRRTQSSYPHIFGPLPDGKAPHVVGFFHPYCNAGGGGERVMWTAIRALQNRYPTFRCVIYTGDTDASRDEILSRAAQRFNISLPRTSTTDLHFVFLNQRKWVEASPYPVLTLLGQSLGSLVLGIEAMVKFVPDVYLDTMGYAFTIPLFRFIGGCKVGCYVHYPTISTDMLQRIADRSESYNNTSVISRSPVLSHLKLIYYKIFAFIYGLAGQCNSVIMVNSTWTYGHIAALWKSPHKTNIVYPPCDVTEFLKIPPNEDSQKTPQSIVSIGQFRPEKDHPLQIKSFSKFLSEISEDERGNYRLVLVGGCRDAADEQRVADLRKLCTQEGVAQSVDFRLNVSFSELKKCLEEATVGLHTMWNEHFGIGVVECMAGGTVMLAHNSGGPKLDIVKVVGDSVVDRTGYLAHDVDTYAEAMQDIFSLTSSERFSIISNARESIMRFTEEEFESGFLSAMETFLR